MLIVIVTVAALLLIPLTQSLQWRSNRHTSRYKQIYFFSAAIIFFAASRTAFSGPVSEDNG
jgi:hypothetical protein